MKVTLIVFLNIALNIFSQTEETNCLPLNLFQQKCEKGLLDIEKYLDGNSLLDDEHKNIMYCYNQLHWDIVGEPISRLIDKDSLYREEKTELKEFDNNQFSMFSELFDAYKNKYNNYIKLIIEEYGASYGLGGALYIEHLKTYPSTANGRTYFILCD